MCKKRKQTFFRHGKPSYYAWIHGYGNEKLLLNNTNKKSQNNFTKTIEYIEGVGVKVLVVSQYNNGSISGG